MSKRVASVAAVLLLAAGLAYRGGMLGDVAGDPAGQAEAQAEGSLDGLVQALARLEQPASSFAAAPAGSRQRAWLEQAQALRSDAVAYLRQQYGVLAGLADPNDWQNRLRDKIEALLIALGAAPSLHPASTSAAPASTGSSADADADALQAEIVLEQSMLDALKGSVQEYVTFYTQYNNDDPGIREYQMPTWDGSGNIVKNDPFDRLLTSGTHGPSGFELHRWAYWYTPPGSAEPTYVLGLYRQLLADLSAVRTDGTSPEDLRATLQTFWDRAARIGLYAQEYLRLLSNVNQYLKDLPLSISKWEGQDTAYAHAMLRHDRTLFDFLSFHHPALLSLPNDTEMRLEGKIAYMEGTVSYGIQLANRQDALTAARAASEAAEAWVRAADGAITTLKFTRTAISTALIVFPPGQKVFDTVSNGVDVLTGQVTPLEGAINLGADLLAGKVSQAGGALLKKLGPQGVARFLAGTKDPGLLQKVVRYATEVGTNGGENTVADSIRQPLQELLRQKGLLPDNGGG